MKKSNGNFMIVGLVLGVCISISGCSTNLRSSDVDGQDISGETKNVIMRKNGQDIEMYDIESYKGRILSDRKPIGECVEGYGQEIETVKNTEYGNFSFSSCSFADMLEFDELYVVMETDHGITTEESWGTIEQWLDSIGKRELVDMEKEVRIVASEIEWDESQEFPYSYPALSEHMDLSSGAGAFVTTTDCHIQISYDGIYSMSDGKMNGYLNDSALAHLGALAEYSGNVVQEGKVSELADESYPLISGELSIGEGAELVKSYFEAGTPFAPNEGVTINVPEVFVFTLGDVYGYDYWVQRIYKGVPIVCGGYKTYVPGSSGVPNEDTKDAYVVDSEGVSAYAGKNASAVLTELYSEGQMIGIEEAVQIMSEKMASRFIVDVEKAGFVYAPISFDEGISNTLFPCWMFSGTNRTKDEGIVIYVDAFTGELYYYTLIEE